ncbi:unnamed protein product, partial [Amoebophrya sp. A120]|eukprot:GSA120T00018194001.1
MPSDGYHTTASGGASSRNLRPPSTNNKNHRYDHAQQRQRDAPLSSACRDGGDHGGAGGPGPAARVSICSRQPQQEAQGFYNLSQQQDLRTTRTTGLNTSNGQNLFSASAQHDHDHTYGRMNPDDLLPDSCPHVIKGKGRGGSSPGNHFQQGPPHQ